MRMETREMEHRQMIRTTVLNIGVLLLLMVILLPGCIIVKGGKEAGDERNSAVAPKPLIPMSEELIRSEPGDMIAFLPEEWFFMDVENKVSSNVFAVAVNPTYTASLVFSEMRHDDGIEVAYGKEGLIGVARASFQRRERKTAGVVKNIGNFDIRTLGTKQFGVYEYVSVGEVITTRVAVFRSSLGNFYECTLATLPFTGRTLLTNDEMEKIYFSVLATIDY